MPLVLFHRNIHRLTEHIFSLDHLADKVILSPATATRYDDVVYDDLYTSKWWAEMQGKVGDKKLIIPLMVSSDATLVSGKGNKSWPMYLTIGNIPKAYRFLNNSGASRVLAYLPVIDVVSHSTKKPWLSLCKTAIFQHCMRIIMTPFANITENGIPFAGPYGKVYSCIPMLASYSADYPEQCLITATKSWRNGFGCPRCLVKARDFKKGQEPRIDLMRNNDNMKRYSQSNDFGCFPIDNAFWETGFDLYCSLLTDDLHQLGGLYKHLLQFTENMIKKLHGKAALVERRSQQLPIYTGIKKFKKGFLLSNLTNPSFDELRQHMRLLLCLVYDQLSLQCTLCLRAFIDFFTQICSKEHTASTLKAADDYLKLFFYYLPAFQDQSKMLMPKLHMMTKYTDDIRMKGPLDSYSTMHSERLHKANAKQPSKRTNFRAATFTKQLVRFVEDRDILFDMYGPLATTTQSQSPAPTHPSFTLASVNSDRAYQRIDYLESHQQNLYGIHNHVRMYLHYLTNQSTRSISLSNCAQLGSLKITTYKQLQITEMNDDLSECKTFIRVGCLYNNTYNDCIRAVDVTKRKIESKYQEFFGKVLTFIEVVHSNGKKYRLCIGHLFHERNVPHPTGYKTLFMKSDPRPELFVCCVEHVLEHVYIVPDFGSTDQHDFLLNHDISQYTWATAAPLLCSLDSNSYVGWATDDDADDCDSEDEEDQESDSGSDNDGSEDDDEIELSQFT
jgi:hypothetical protein